MTITSFVSEWQQNAILVVAKPGAKVKEVNPLGLRFKEIFRGLLNDQTVNRNWTMSQHPLIVRIAP